MAEGKERRQSRRVSTEIEFSLTGIDGRRVAGRARNLSAGGAYLELERPIAPLSKLEIQLQLPRFGDSEGTPICAEAIVVRAEPSETDPARYSIGIAFMNLKAEDRRRLEDYIEWRMTRSLIESAQVSS